MIHSLKNKITTDHVLLLIILITAATLRFWNFHELPFMHDELSALERTKYTSLHDEINYGVAIYDTHPAGIQLFIYYWIKIFGISEMTVKFPFIILGILSIIIAYKISKKWFNSSVGLIVASFMAVLQYMVMYSQIARPYIPGMFFSLLMVWYWSNYLFDENSIKKNKWLIGYIISSALCAYTHHFSSLFAAIVTLTGLFFLTKETWKKYLLAVVAIFILYIPHLNILFFQFDKGGLGGPNGWLGKPEKNWFSGYLKYVFHFSSPMYALILLLLLLSIFFYSKDILSKQKFRVIALIWFFLLFFIEYYYSLFINPVIQYSTLIFAFPFLLIFLFSMFGELNRNVKIVVVAVILISGTSTLVFSRKHFQVFYKQPYQEQVINTYKSLDIIKDEKKATIELMIPPYYREYYFKKYNRRFESIFYNPFDAKPDMKAFRKFVQSLSTDYFIAGNLPLEYFQIIKEKYPYMILKEEGFTYSIYCFSRNNQVQEIKEKIVFSGMDNSGKGSLFLDNKKEYSPAFLSKLKDMINDRHNIINVTATLNSADSVADPLLVLDIVDKEKSLLWAGAEYFWYNNDPKKSNKVYLSQLLCGIDLKKHPNAEVKIYVWNRNKKRIEIENINIEVVESNPFIYGLYEPLD